MASGMTMKVLLQLQAKGFNSALKSVQGALDRFKSSFMQVSAALGAGMGFVQLMSKAKDTAKALSVANATLKNVSATEEELAKNQAFLNKTAADYHQNIIELTHNFSQFHAACKNTNLSLKQQQDIFKSLAKASAFYHLSAEQSQNVQVAITQMISKGKVSAEELRRQLGNSLPGAFNLMAAAMKISTAELEVMMKKGQVISEEVLPKFAKMLMAVTRNLDTDSLQLALNDLANAWTRLIDRMNIEGAYKNIVQRTTSLLDWLKENLGRVKSDLLAVFTSIASYKVFNSFKAGSAKYFDYLQTRLKGFQSQMSDAKAQWTNILNSNPAYSPTHISSKIVSQDATTGKYSVGSMGGLVSAEDMKKLTKATEDYNKALDKANATQKKVAATNKVILSTGISGTNLLAKGWMSVKYAVISVGQALKSIAIMAIASAIVGVITKVVSSIKESRKEIERINNIVKDSEKDFKEIENHISEQRVEIETLLDTIKDMEKPLEEREGAYERLVEITGELSDGELNIKDNLEDIVSLANDWVDRLTKVSRIQGYIGIAAQADNKVASLQDTLNGRVKEFNESKRLNGGNRLEDLINLDTGERNPSALLKTNVKWTWVNKNIDNLITEIQNLKTVSKNARDKAKELGADVYQSKNSNGLEPNTEGAIKEEFDKAANKIQQSFDIKGDLKEFNREMLQLYDRTIDKMIDASLNVKDGWGAEIVAGFKKYQKLNDRDTGRDRTRTPEDIAKSLQKEYDALKTMYDTGNKSEKDFYSELKTLLERHLTDYLEAGGKADSGFFTKWSGELKVAKAKVGSVDLDENVSKTLKDFGNDTSAAKTRLTGSALSDELDSIADTAMEKITELEPDAEKLDAIIVALGSDFAKLWEQLKEAYRISGENKNKKEADWWNKYYRETAPKTIQGRNKREDYKKSQYEIDLADVDYYEDTVERLQSAIDKVKDKWGQDVEAAKKEITALERIIELYKQRATAIKDKAVYSQYLAYLKDLKNELGSGIANGVKNFATSMDRVVKGWESLNKTIEDGDSAWDKAIATFNYMCQIFDTIISSIETINKLTEISKKISQAASNGDMISLGKQVGQGGTSPEQYTADAAAKIADAEATKELTKQTLELWAAEQLKAGASPDTVESMMKELGAILGITVAKKAEARATEESAIASGVKAAADNKEAGAAMLGAGAAAAKSIAEGSESVAKIPYVGAILAVAAAASIAGALIAAFGKFKFAQGGVVPGSSYSGDKVPAMVNSGEMILNRGQQSTLFNLLNGKGGLGGSDVEFRIRGVDLVGTMNNYKKRMKG